LLSSTLRDDQALQTCLVRDQAHVVPGAQGPHVAKIQRALLLLDQAHIDANDLRTKRYGPSTTAAVLAYKRKRKIINPAYQTSADNIVGKMTIARMDEELLAAERRITLNVVCHDRGAGGSFALAQPPPAALRITAPSAPINHAKVLDIVLQRTENVKAGFDDRIPTLMARARLLMRGHGLDFAQGLPEIGPVVPYEDFVHPGLAVDTFAVREASERVLPGRDRTLRVIFCFFKLDATAFGVTDGGKLTSTGPERRKFSLINILKKHEDDGTLLHEMIHAAYPQPKFDHDGDRRSIFSESVSGRDRLPDVHAAQLAAAYFAHGR
jgi:hypothetical protein